MNRTTRRIAFYGGTFDPCHLGHLQMAAAAADHLKLHRVYFVPAARNPLKERGPEATASQRLDMLERATRADDRFSIWEGEVYRDGPSYTLHSVEHIERVYPNAHLFWIIGSDHLPHLNKWYCIEKLVRKIRFILVQRPGHDFTWPGIPGLYLFPVENPLVPISSSNIRQFIREGKAIDDFVPPEVARFIREQHLYQPSPGS